jgi:hypothetical protein
MPKSRKMKGGAAQTSATVTMSVAETQAKMRALRLKWLNKQAPQASAPQASAPQAAAPEAAAPEAAAAAPVVELLEVKPKLEEIVGINEAAAILQAVEPSTVSPATLASALPAVLNAKPNSKQTAAAENLVLRLAPELVEPAAAIKAVAALESELLETAKEPTVETALGNEVKKLAAELQAVMAKLASSENVARPKLDASTKNNNVLREALQLAADVSIEAEDVKQYLATLLPTVDLKNPGNNLLLAAHRVLEALNAGMRPEEFKPMVKLFLNLLRQKLAGKVSAVHLGRLSLNRGDDPADIFLEGVKLCLENLRAVTPDDNSLFVIAAILYRLKSEKTREGLLASINGAALLLSSGGGESEEAEEGAENAELEEGAVASVEAVAEEARPEAAKEVQELKPEETKRVEAAIEKELEAIEAEGLEEVKPAVNQVLEAARNVLKILKMAAVTGGVAVKRFALSAGSKILQALQVLGQGLGMLTNGIGFVKTALSALGSIFKSILGGVLKFGSWAAGGAIQGLLSGIGEAVKVAAKATWGLLRFGLNAGQRLAQFLYDNFPSLLDAGKAVALFGGKFLWYGGKAAIFVLGGVVRLAGGALSLITGIGRSSSSANSSGPRIRQRNNRGMLDLMAEAAAFTGKAVAAPLGLRRGERFKRGALGGSLTRRKMGRRQRRKTAKKY